MNRKMNVATEGRCYALECTATYASGACMEEKGASMVSMDRHRPCPPCPPISPIDPCANGGTLPAGMVCEKNPFAVEETPYMCDMLTVEYAQEMPLNVRLAQIIFPIQEYKEGFCPDIALAKGTLFPELVF